MRDAGIDVLLVTDPNNLTYLTGYRTNLFDSKFRPFVALLPLESDPILILPSLEKGVGEETSWITDIRTWGTRPGDLGTDPLAAIISIIKSAGFGASTIGIELSNQRMGLSYDNFSVIKSGLPEASWGDLSPILWALRAIKSPAEIANLRKAAEITDAAYHKVLEVAHEGMSEREIQAVMGEVYMARGSDLKGFIVVASGPVRYKMANPYASGRTLERGDMVVLDFGAVYDGYWCDLTRGFFVGEVSDYQRELYEISVAATAATVEYIKPGMLAEDPDIFSEKYIVDAGKKDLLMHRTGHSIGLEVHELPSLGLGDKSVLQPGMVCAVEPAMYDFAVGCFRMEDIVEITEDGATYLSNCRRELTIV